MKVVELLSEGLISGLNKQVAADLQRALDAKGANLAKVEVATSSDGNQRISVKMNTKGGQLTRAAVRRVLDDYLLPKFGKGNVLGVDYQLSMAASNLYYIYFHRQVNEAYSPLLRKTIERIQKTIEELNYDYRKSAEIDFDLFRKVVVFEYSGDPHMMVFMSSNATDGEQESYREVLEDTLKDMGFMGGIMPIQVTVSSSNSEKDAFVIHFNRR